MNIFVYLKFFVFLKDGAPSERQFKISKMLLTILKNLAVALHPLNSFISNSSPQYNNAKINTSLP